MRRINRTSHAQSTRRRLFQSVLESIGYGIAVVLIVFGIGWAEVVDQVVAVVNNDIILLSDLEQTLASVAAALNQQGHSASKKKEILNEQRKRIIDQLIYDKLTDQQVQRFNIKIDDAEVDATIERIRNVNRMSDEDLRRALELDNLSYDQYRQQIKDRMLRTRLVNREVKSKIVITEEDIRAYYDSHKREYGGLTKYDLSHLLIKVPPTAGSSEKERALKQINDIYKRLKDGAAFDMLAGQYSEAPSAERNGHLGVFDINLLSDQTRQAVEGLDAKQFSQVVDTDQGYQIFYVEQIIQSGGRPLEEVRAEIQEKLYADVVDQKFNEWIKDLRQRSHIQIMELQADMTPATSTP